MPISSNKLPSFKSALVDMYKLKQGPKILKSSNSPNECSEVPIQPSNTNNKDKRTVLTPNVEFSPTKLQINPPKLQISPPKLQISPLVHSLSQTPILSTPRA